MRNKSYWKKNINRNKASVSEGVGTQRGAATFCTCSVQKGHTVPQNQPKLVPHAKGCYCIPFTVASPPAGLRKPCSWLP